jgi:NADH-quinone oxidoreductase subunit N
MLYLNLISPEIFILSMTCIIMLLDLFVPQTKQLLTYGLTQFTMLGVVFLVLAIYSQESRVIFDGLYIHDQLGSILKIAICLMSIFVFLYARDYMRDRDLLKGEPYLLGLFSILGMMILVSAHNFLTIYLGLELTSLPLYALVALDRESKLASEAGIKYFVLGALASGMMLYGISLIYGATGTLDITQVNINVVTFAQQHMLLLIMGLVFIVAGIAFKIGLVPFHMWLPDVFAGASNAALLFVAVTPKVAAFGLVFRLLVTAMGSFYIQWQEIFIVIAILSMLVGNVVAIAQTNIKRMLAYSTIAHGGYMLLGFCAATGQGYGSALFYTITYGIMILGGFGLVTILSRKGYEMESIDDLRGLNQRNPWLAFMWLLLLFSMAGIPPTVGFFAKFGVLEALISAHLIWLAALAMLFAVIGSYYYLRVVKVIYFDQPINEQPVVLPFDTRVGISVNGLAILLLAIFPSSLIELCHQLFV